MLLDRLAELKKAHPSLIDRTIEDLSAEREPNELPPPFIGAKRAALDYAFRHNTVEKIIEDLEALTSNEDPEVRRWASETQTVLHARSPTSLKVALYAIRRGKHLSLVQALEMETKVATAYCVSASYMFL